MPFGMGHAGWFYGPYSAPWMRLWSPWFMAPYGMPLPPFTQAEEVAFLEEQAKILEDQLGQIQKRLDELKKQKKESK
ncbi:MAG: DUF5320 domain-containing protein [Candidatus Aminicenantales bacterium]